MRVLSPSAKSAPRIALSGPAKKIKPNSDPLSNLNTTIRKFSLALVALVPSSGDDADTYLSGPPMFLAPFLR